jgi:putative SOS response-associated peptidase YedK
MCGRARLELPVDDVVRLLQAEPGLSVDDQGVREGVAGLPRRGTELWPDDPLLALMQCEGASPRVGWLRFGFVAEEVARGPSRLVLHARSETVWDRAMFQTAAHERRCAVVVDGFYEWTAAKKKTLIARADAQPFFLLGLVDPSATRCVLLTQAARGPLAQVRDRMPLLVESLPEVMNWLDRKCDVEDAMAAARAFARPLALRDLSKQLSLF